MIQKTHVVGLFALTTFCLIMAGCGEKNVTTSLASKEEASASCLGCHESTLSPVTAKVIASEWKNSNHNIKNGAGCIDCHEPEQNHPSSCNRCHASTPTGSTATSVTHNPDSSGKCVKCHTSSSGFGLSTVDGVTIDLQTAHYNKVTDSKYPASYVSSMYDKNCRKCHNPHDTASAKSYLQQWARSGHGNVNSGARTSYDFKTMGSFKPAAQEFTDTTQKAVCVRCHTSTGYINYVTSDFSELKPFAGNGSPVVKYDYLNPPADNSKISSDLTREVTACNVCHDNGNGSAYNYALRNVAKGSGVTVYYNYSGSIGSAISHGIRNNKIIFPSAGTSNMCVVCHSGRENGDIIKMASVREIKFDNVSRIGSHDRAAAANIFRKSGFEFYSSETMYFSSSYMHDIIGIDTTKTNSRGLVFSGQNADSRLYGPCIGCHMNSPTSHTYKPLLGTDSSWTEDVSQPFASTNKVSSIASKTCINCHDEAKVPKLEDSWTPDALQVERDKYRATLKAFWYILQYTLAANSLPKDAAKPLGPANATINPTGLTHWYNSAGTTKKALVQPWLQNNNKNTDSRLSFYDPIMGAQTLKNGAFNMGAAFNYTMLVADPGAYVHNRRYIKKLIYDSIDWLDDGIINQSVYYTFSENTPRNWDTKNISNPAYALNLKNVIGATDYALSGSYLGFVNRTTGAWTPAKRLAN